MRAKVEWREGVQFGVESGSGHQLTTDGPPASGGQNAGPRPMELVLMGVAACSSYDVAQFLQKGRGTLESCLCSIEAERAETTPKVFTTIHMHFQVRGQGISEARLARAVELSANEHCSASIMLARAGVEITHSHELLE